MFELFAWHTYLYRELLLCSTYFGKEREVSCNREFDIHRAELDSNHWMLTSSVPGNEILDVQPPDDNDKTTCQNVCDARNCTDNTVASL